MTNEVEAGVGGSPRPEVLERRHPLEDARAIDGGADAARSGVLLGVNEGVRDALLHGERRATLAGDLRGALAEAGALLRIGEELDDGATEGGFCLLLLTFSLSGRQDDPVHALITELRTLPDAIRRNTYLYHYGDEWDSGPFNDVHDAFAGFAEPRKRYVILD